MAQPLAQLWVGEPATEIPLDAGLEWCIGRAAECEVFLNSLSVSRKHARITREGSDYFVEDLGSRAGTRVNGEAVRSTRRLHPGDSIEVGEVRIRFELLGADNEVSAGLDSRSAQRELCASGEGSKAAAPAPPAPAAAPPTPSSDRAEPGPAPRPVGAPPPIGESPPATPAGAGGSAGQTVFASPEALARYSADAPVVKLDTGSIVRPVGRKQISGTMTIGRAEHCTVVLPDPTVSSEHAEVRHEAGGFTIRDLRSTNGTYVNGREVLGKVTLEPGARIQIGPFVLEFDGTSVAGSNEGQTVQISTRALGKTVTSRDTGQPLKLLDQIDLVIAPCEFVGLLGESGSGKSTFLDAINGRRRATEGSVLYNAADLYRQFDVFRSKIACVPQDVIFHEQLSVRRAMYYTAKLRLPPDTSRAEIDAAISDSLGILGIQERAHTRIADLSGGQKKRVAIGLELLARPSVLFLDEATSGLDHATEERMMGLFRRVADDGKTVVCITHFTDSLDHCDQVAFFVKGRLAFYGSPAELKEYFGIRAIKDVYALTAERPPSEWAERYANSPLFQKYIAARGATVPGGAAAPAGGSGVERTYAGRQPGAHLLSPPALPMGLGQSNGAPARSQPFSQVVRQWRVLTRRYVEVLLGDRRNLLLLLLQAPIIALMVALVFHNMTPIPAGSIVQSDAFSAGGDQVAAATGDRTKALLILVVASIWCGGMASGREIVKERSVYLHERFVNLNPMAYIASKVPPLTAVCFVQTFLLCTITFAAVDLGGDAVPQFIMLFVTATAAMFLGLVLSCAVSKQDQVSSVFPVILVAQVVFSGGIVTLEGAADALAKVFVLARWSFEGMKATLPEGRLALGGDVEPFGLSLLVACVFLVLYAGAAYALLALQDRKLGLSAR